MKRLIPILILLISFSSFSQDGKKIKERIKAQKVAFITDKLALTSEEAQQFWPIYNDIEAKKEALKKKSVSKRKAKKPDDLTEKEAEVLLNEMLDIEDQKHQLQRELFTKLRKVISNKKIVDLMRAEREFDRKLLDKLKDFRERRQNRKN
ncbi:sensor of ECF-type sigma factor [Winogradskyella sp.]|jgi:predicted DNA-binding transcriptional regulator YafY|uniref:sensor of ECF-type sigma factor n=1 Tax=Winogradskyella sp. TaxID=1883156 RepID=UPI0025E70629|nr:sensor of ECF-type sigma factor [Winogradskyella sp.]MCT4630910.1 sensor of ECF-type sigma factor [Winogradskyella sp.]